ncbi:MAG: helix-turn-helix transcriptional regulator [Treponema sp.]|nr:helix-turn-helix transcriptional regulator [Treponema sp.]
MSHKDLAEKLGVTEVTVSRWLSGERDPSIETLNRIAEALGTSTSYFFITDDWQLEKELSARRENLMADKMKIIGYRCKEVQPCRNCE